MTLRLVAGITWVVLVALAAFGAPPSTTDPWPWIVDLMVGRWGGTEPWVVVEFQMMGLWPLWWASLEADRLRSRPVPAWPFLVGSMALGAFVWLPWLAFAPRRALPEAGGPERTVAAPALASISGAAALGLVLWGLWAGDLATFDAVRARDPFVWTMTFDFAALWLVTIPAAAEDARRRGGGPWAVTLVPVLGTVAWLLVRPRPAVVPEDRSA